jgi:hypothetical protein
MSTNLIRLSSLLINRRIIVAINFNEAWNSSSKNVFIYTYKETFVIHADDGNFKNDVAILKKAMSYSD